MLSAKKDIYASYTEDTFKKAFQSYFKIARQEAIGDSCRDLFFMIPHES
jgi:hypothetical protein